MKIKLKKRIKYAGDIHKELMEAGFTSSGAAELLKHVPDAKDVAPVVHGKWEYDKDATDWGIGGYVCSECKNKNNNLPCTRVKWVKMFSGARYCPNCGAKMDVENNE